jgi:hypothetical protein
MLDVISRDAAPDDDLPSVLLHDQVPNLVVRHPMDLGLGLFDERWAGPHHDQTSRGLLPDRDEMFSTMS